MTFSFHLFYTHYFLFAFIKIFRRQNVGRAFAVSSYFQLLIHGLVVHMKSFISCIPNIHKQVCNRESPHAQVITNVKLLNVQNSVYLYKSIRFQSICGRIMFCMIYGESKGSLLLICFETESPIVDPGWLGADKGPSFCLCLSSPEIKWCVPSLLFKSLS